MGLFDLFKSKAQPPAQSADLDAEPPAYGWDAITRAFEQLRKENPMLVTPIRTLGEWGSG